MMVHAGVRKYECTFENCTKSFVSRFVLVWNIYSIASKLLNSNILLLLSGQNLEIMKKLTTFDALTSVIAARKHSKLKRTWNSISDTCIGV